MTGSDWWQLIGVLALMVTQAFVMWRWFVSRQDQQRRDLDDKLATAVKAMQGAVEQVHSRINDVRDQYVKQSDFDRHIGRFETEMKSIGGDVRRQHEHLTGRIDAVLAAINTLAINRAETPNHK